MNVNDILAKLVTLHHVPVRDFVFGGADLKFLTCFDEVGNLVSTDDVSEVSDGGKQGDVDSFTPKPGVGYYAHLFLAGQGGSGHGGSTRYQIAGPDWRTTAHVTEPSAGGSPDVVVEPFAMTPGANAFIAGIAAKM
jgi:hypothetical protein